MLFRRALFVILSCVFCSTVFADPECPIGYGLMGTDFILSGNLFKATTTQITREGTPNTPVPEFDIGKYGSYAANNYRNIHDLSVVVHDNSLTFTPIADNYGYGIVIKVKPNTTYTLSYQTASAGGQGIAEYKLGENGYVFNRTITYGNRNRKITVTTSEDGEALLIILGNTGLEIGKSATYLNIMLVEGSEIPPTYVDYFHYYDLPIIGECTLCPPNTYKDFVGNEPCTPCPNGLMSPAGATNIDECVRIMHIGGKIYPLNSVKKTSPALHIRDENGHVWYGNLYSQD